MSSWISTLQKSGFSIDEIGFLNLNKSVNKNWKIVGEGTYGIVFSFGDKILKVQKDIKSNNKFNKNRVVEFLREVNLQKMVYNCTKGRSSLTPKIFAYGKNWVLMKNAPGKSIWEWYISNRKGVFQKAMRAYINALKKIHKRCGIGHFDAHGDNAMYDPETNSIKIIDWGFATSINQNNITKQGLLKRYKKVLTNKLGMGWERREVEWVTKMKRNPLGQYAIEVIPYNARFKDLKPKDNIADFMKLILSNTNNFPTPTPVSRKDFLKSMLGRSKTPTSSSSSSSGELLF
jgi:serine/threonine protein kinase